MKKFWQKIGLGAMAALMLCGAPQAAQAEVVQGSAVVLNGNVERAKRDARNDAMRTYLEKQVGVHVSSYTETSMFMLVSDRVVARSDGYVQIKKIISEKQQGDIVTVTLDLEADSKRLETEMQDVKSRLEMLGRDSSRSGIAVAVTGVKNSFGYEGNMMLLNSYVQCGLEDIGFRTKVNDAVRDYMQGKDMSDPRTGAMARTIGRNSRGAGENGMLRGTLSTLIVKPVQLGKEKGFAATVTAAFELVGYDNDDVNSFAENVTQTGTTQAEAVDKAYNEATRLACQRLGEKALKTIQSIGLEAVICVDGLSDRMGQKRQVVEALQSRGVDILRSSFDAQGRLLVAVHAPGYSMLEDLKNDLLSGLPDLQEANEDNRPGSTRIYLTY